MLTLIEQDQGFIVTNNGKSLLSHQTTSPAFFIGEGQESIEMYRGNFDIKDYIETRMALTYFSFKKVDQKEIIIDFYLSEEDKKNDLAIFSSHFQQSGSSINLDLKAHSPNYNRLWIRTPTTPTAPVWGGGEQMSYFNLRGKHFPFWTSEPGVGRDKSTYITWRSDVENKAGGDYYHTNYPQPTFISLTPNNESVYALHANTTAYSAFDFRHDSFHELHFWEIPSSLVWFFDDKLTGIVEKLSLYFGRQPKLPDWIIGGAILGLKNGIEHAKIRLSDALDKGVQVSGIWCEDWSGIRETSFGVRLFWDWQANEKRYPDLKNWIKTLNQKNIQFLAYTNPYLCIDGPLYQEAKALGYMATQSDGSEYHVDFGEFYCGVVDFTLESAKLWFSERIIQQEMLDIGIKGWMADFGEYLPIDLKLSDNSCPKVRHNEWPVLWAQVNAHAIAQKNETGDAVFFMRAGFSGVQKHCPLLWGGDQSVDFSRHDGLVTVIPAALSSGLLGNAYHHSDIGGYTSLFGNVRTAELFMRWAEMSLFTPVMRTHEGNRPSENFQFWQDETAYEHFAKMTQLHVALVPYVKTLIEQAYHQGLPLQRPLVLHYQNDETTFDIFDQYLYGEDLLIAPVYEAGANTRSLYLPQGEVWINIWTQERYKGGQTLTVLAPIGSPAVFIREKALDNTSLSDFLLKIKNI